MARILINNREKYFIFRGHWNKVVRNWLEYLVKKIIRLKLNTQIFYIVYKWRGVLLKVFLNLYVQALNVNSFDNFFFLVYIFCNDLRITFASLKFDVHTARRLDHIQYLKFLDPNIRNNKRFHILYFTKNNNTK